MPRREHAPTQKVCKGCATLKPIEAFEHRRDSLGRSRPCRNCLLCNSSLGHKPCKVCKIDKPIDQYQRVKPNGQGRSYYRSDCNRCRKLAYQTPRKPRPEHYEPRLAKAKERPGYTSPPTADELAALHWQNVNRFWPNGVS